MNLFEDALKDFQLSLELCVDGASICFDDDSITRNVRVFSKTDFFGSTQHFE